MINILCFALRVVGVFSGRSCEDPTLLTAFLQQTELVGLMQLLYAILLSDGPPRHSHIPPPLTQHTLAIATATIKVVNNSAILDLDMVQVIHNSIGWGDLPAYLSSIFLTYQINNSQHISGKLEYVTQFVRICLKEKFQYPHKMKPQINHYNVCLLLYFKDNGGELF